MSLLAKLENSIKDPAPEAEAPETEAPEAEAPETEAPEAEAEAEPDAPESEEPVETAPEETDPTSPDTDTTSATKEPEGTQLDPKAKFQVGEDVVTGEELRNGYLRQADYTRKTQALAEREKVRDAAMEELREQVADFADWATLIRDHKEMRHELETAMPETFAALREAIIDEAVEEADMSPREKEARQRARKLEDAERLRVKEEQARSKKAERKAQAQKTNELRVQYNTWSKEVMEEAGLDPKKAEHVDLLHAKVMTFKGTWDRNVFLEAAKLVGRAVGAKKKTPAPAPAAKDASKPKLPPVASTGAKKPAAAKSEDKAPPAKVSGSFFDKLRRNHGQI